MIKNKEKIVIVRSNTRIFPEQKKFIEELSKKTGHGEGHIIREIIKFYMDNYNK